MTIFEIPVLLDIFDGFTPQGSWLAGKLGSFLGEDMLLDVYAHFRATTGGGPVGMIESEVPRRDNKAFGAYPVPSVRDLDAWLVQDGSLMACECKQWTASSADTRRPVPADPQALADFARAQWAVLITPEVWQEMWTGTTKIALPLKPPTGWSEQAAADARRVLIIWRPLSETGTGCESVLATTTLREGFETGLEVTVFSASLYLRQLLAAGTTALTGNLPRLDAALALLRTVAREGTGGPDSDVVAA